jgi:pyrimidine 5'-nucleotidase
VGYSTVFFDLDDTLYPSTSGLWQAIGDKMDVYLEEVLGLPEQEVAPLRMAYAETYGTTLRGLMANFQVDADDFLRYVHDLPLDRYLQPDPHLRALIAGLPQHTWVFTNADASHASRVLGFLGLEGLFEGVIDVRALQFLSKPDPLAYQKAMQIAGEADPHRCVLIDDSAKNLRTARELGFLTILVGDHQVDYLIRSVHDLPSEVPQLWERAA